MTHASKHKCGCPPSPPQHKHKEHHRKVVEHHRPKTKEHHKKVNKPCQIHKTPPKKQSCVPCKKPKEHVPIHKTIIPSLGHPIHITSTTVSTHRTVGYSVNSKPTVTWSTTGNSLAVTPPSKQLAYTGSSMELLVIVSVICLAIGSKLAFKTKRR